MDTVSIDDFAKQMYETYCESVGGKAFNGDTLPNWEGLVADAGKVKIVEAWRAVATKAIELFIYEAFVDKTEIK